MKKTGRWTRHAGVALLAGWTIGPAAEQGAGQESFRLTGTEVAIYNLAGRVEVVRGPGEEVVVRVTRGGAGAARALRGGSARGCR